MSVHVGIDVHRKRLYRSKTHLMLQNVNSPTINHNIGYIGPVSWSIRTPVSGDASRTRSKALGSHER